MANKKHFTISKSLREERMHGDYAFPFEFIPSSLSHFANGYVECHWHPEVELIIVTKGSMSYFVNESVLELTEGTGIFINANSFHMTSPTQTSDCDYYTFIFHPRLLYGYENSTLQKQYYEPITESLDFPVLFLNSKDPQQTPIVEHAFKLADICYTNADADDYYYLNIQLELLLIWQQLFGQFKQHKSSSAASPMAHKYSERMKQILNYIHINYAKKITLGEISAAGNLCENECCRFFKRTLHQTPFEYLMHYRVQKSIPMLVHREQSITEIALNNGFNSSGYYSEVFKRQMGITPSQYQKLNAKEKAAN